MNDTSTSPNLSERQRAILEFARDRGHVQVDNLAHRFTVTSQTIRRDLNHLSKLRLLRRMHGGAEAYHGVVNLGYDTRKRVATAEKSAIGQRAAQLVPDDSSLFINIGTTTEQVAGHLRSHVGLLVITNNLNVVNTLRSSETIDVMTAGGTVRREDGGIVGEATAEFISQFKVDYAVIGASAIESDGTVLDFDMREVRVAQSIIANARSVILVADTMKFQRNAPVRIGNIRQVDHFVTDHAPPDDFVQVCTAHDVSIEVAMP